jgi:hypothetical protein
MAVEADTRRLSIANSALLTGSKCLLQVLQNPDMTFWEERCEGAIQLLDAAVGLAENVDKVPDEELDDIVSRTLMAQTLLLELIEKDDP